MDTRRVAAADVLILAYGAAATVLVVILAVLGRLPGAGWLLLAHAGVAVAVGALLWIRRTHGGRVWQVLGAWYPLAFVPLAFRELNDLVPAAHPQDLDSVLLQLDLDIFGVHPALWLEQACQHPLLTEILQWVYVTFYFIPVSLALALYLRGRSREFETVVLAVLLGFFSSYVGYFLVPAVGPEHLLEGQFAGPLNGVWRTPQVRQTLDMLELDMRDCFPSGHTEVSLITLWMAWRFHRRLAVVLTPLVTALVFSTVYLRYHYVVDLVAGAALAIPICLLCDRFRIFLTPARGTPTLPRIVAGVEGDPPLNSPPDEGELQGEKT